MAGLSIKIPLPNAEDAKNQIKANQEKANQEKVQQKKTRINNNTTTKNIRLNLDDLKKALNKEKN